MVTVLFLKVNISKMVHFKDIVTVDTEDFGHYVTNMGSEDFRTLWQRDDFGCQAISSGCQLDDQPIAPCYGPLKKMKKEFV